jgi:O-antigen/teichoic acid export membrane protein
LVPSGLMQWTCGNLFIVAAPAYLGISAAGAMRASQTLMGIVNIWYQGLENVIPIRAGRLYRDGGVQHAVRYVVRMAVIWGLATGVVIALASIYARELLRLVYGPDAAEYYWVLRWYAALNALMFLGLPVRSLLRAFEETGGIFGGFLAASIFSIVAVVPLLSRFGLAGAVFGVIGAQAVFQCVLMFNAYRSVKDRTPQSGELLTAPV